MMLKSIKTVVTIAALASLAWISASAQPNATEEREILDPGPFYGFWEIQEPAGDSCVLIIKRGGRVSCFWSGTSNSRFQKGSWERNGNRLVARWDSGYIDVYRTLGENTIQRKSYPSGSSLEGEAESVARGVRVDSRIPGSLTTNSPRESNPVADSSDPVSAPAIPVRNAYTGFWKVEQDTGFLGIGNDHPAFYLNLQRDGEVTVSLRAWKVDKGVRGSWQIEDDEVRITWPEGRKDILRSSSGEAFQLAEFTRKQDWEDKPKNVRPAEKIPAAEATRYFQAGEVQLLTTLDIRGVWVPNESDTQREYVEVEGWGNAYRYPAQAGEGSDPGKWRLLNDRVVITWVDGSKDVIRRELSSDQFIQESFPPGEPLTGTPSRSIEVRKVESR